MIAHYILFLLFLNAQSSHQFRLLNVSKNSNSLINSKSVTKSDDVFNKLELIIPKKNTSSSKTVISSDTKNVKAVPFTINKSNLLSLLPVTSSSSSPSSSSSSSSSPSSSSSSIETSSSLFTSASSSFSDSVNNKVEAGVGPPPVFEVASSASSKVDPLDNYFTEEGDLKIEISDIEPVYVTPPNGFKPVIYPDRALDGIGIRKYHHGLTPTLPLPSQSYPYKYPNGVVSWMFGGTRGLERGGYWESLGSDTALHKPSSHPIRFPLINNSLPVKSKWIQLLPEKSRKHYNKRYPFASSSSPFAFDTGYNRVVSPVLFGLSSWLFGGIKDLDSSIWQAPPLMIEKIEVVPMSNQHLSSLSPSSSSLSSSSSSSLSSSSSPSSSSSSAGAATAHISSHTSHKPSFPFPLYWF